MKDKLWLKNLLLVLLLIVIVTIPLLLLKDASFAGADGEAQELVSEIDPDYQAWSTPLFEPASGEIESMFFSLQAAIGAGIVCFILGRMTAPGRRREDGDG